MSVVPTTPAKTVLKNRLQWNEMDQDYLRQLVGLAKIEDLAGAGLAQRPEQLGDVTSALMPENVEGSADLSAREPLVACGLGMIPLVLDAYHTECHFEPSVADGDPVAANQSMGRLTGPANALLQAERILLNFLQHLCGIATETRRYVDALEDSPTALLDTRKTLPGYRVLQKYAFACGGGYNHRIGLFDRFMLKDNHLALCGATKTSTIDAIELARKTGSGLPIEVEVDSIRQIPPLLEAGVDIILLDNFSDKELSDAIQLIDGQVFTEASGGISLQSLFRLRDLGLDFISTGSPVHQSTWKDIGLDWIQ
ncbi:MAG: carboxylating nicotinate-nucleotide diphosphorylase [Coraliomargaritaceae bacterium]